MGMPWSTPLPGTYTSGKDTLPIDMRLDGRQGRSGWKRKISPPPGFDPRTVQPVASSYTDWATTDMQYWLKLYKMNTHDPGLCGQKEECRNFVAIINMGWSKKQYKSALYYMHNFLGVGFDKMNNCFFRFTHARGFDKKYSRSFLRSWCAVHASDTLFSEFPLSFHCLRLNTTNIFICPLCSPCHHGMARPQVADRGTASDKEGSCE